MDKTFLAIVGSVVIAWTLTTFDSQEIKTAEFALDNQSTIVQEVKWRLRDTSSYTIYRCRPSSYSFSNICVQMQMRKMISGALIVLALNVSIASPSQAYWVEKWGGVYWCDVWGCR